MSEFQRRADMHHEIDLGPATAVFTTRHGGVSQGPYSALNLGLNTEDTIAIVNQNYERICGQLGRSSIYTARQVHGTDVSLRTDPIGEGLRVGVDADGQITTRKDGTVAVQVADCIPVVVAGRTAVAALHAGWRGLADGVIAAGVNKLREVGAEGPLVAAIGPGAGGCCFEIGDEVREAFTYLPQGWFDERGESTYLDLRRVAKHALETAGVEEIHDIDICTICSDPQEFFSFRRDDGKTGRQIAAAWLN